MEKREKEDLTSSVGGVDASSRESDEILEISNEARMKRLVRKIDFHLMPFMVSGYLSFQFMKNLLTLATI
jgi:hypothetical protein